MPSPLFGAVARAPHLLERPARRAKTPTTLLRAAVLALLIFACVHRGASEKCAPKCEWNCNDLTCPPVCHPICSRPQCEMRCDPQGEECQGTVGCTKQCEKPICSIRCPADYCPDSKVCPQCEVVCAPPQCAISPNIGQCRCRDEPMCVTTCDAPRCRWECDETCPGNCKPVCERPVCKVDCPATCATMTSDCKSPNCYIRCPKAEETECCSNRDACPQCELVCPPPECGFFYNGACSGDKLNCKPACEDLDCQVKCVVPTNCAHRKCLLTCQPGECGEPECCPCTGQEAAQAAIDSAVCSSGDCSRGLLTLLQVINMAQTNPDGFGRNVRLTCCPCPPRTNGIADSFSAPNATTTTSRIAIVSSLPSAIAADVGSDPCSTNGTFRAARQIGCLDDSLPFPDAACVCANASAFHVALKQICPSGGEAFDFWRAQCATTTYTSGLSTAVTTSATSTGMSSSTTKPSAAGSWRSNWGILGSASTCMGILLLLT
ncbi:hypothetical protein DFJ74DRAFT_375362 [Hyaloraphidium curvatum]|nr:hypothetical protein DFJ74DRAFT_375362 [Hyaloraphidium curvatum]